MALDAPNTCTKGSLLLISRVGGGGGGAEPSVDSLIVEQFSMSWQSVTYVKGVSNSIKV